jgi:tetratricopeptide (TPR) repeat protein
MHPLIRAHYLDKLNHAAPQLVRGLHLAIADFYLGIYLSDPGPRMEVPSVDLLKPLFESVHHGCRGGAFDQAYQVYRKLIEREEKYVLTGKLAAHDTGLALLLEFFPGGDTSTMPLISNPSAQGAILNSVGFRLTSLGRLAEAVPFFERALAITLERKEHVNACADNLGLSQLYAHLGRLTDSRNAAEAGLALARKVGDPTPERFALCDLGWAAHLLGDVTMAKQSFEQAEAILRQTEPFQPYLYHRGGLCQADYLLRTGKLDYGRRVTLKNLEISRRNRWVSDVSECHRILGDLDAAERRHDGARENYEQAVHMARGIADRSVLIKALLARGRWAARLGQVEAARSDLLEALTYSVESGYGVCEVETRIGLGWAHVKSDDHASARAEAQRAQNLSLRMSYRWGQVDAAEVLAAISQG